MTNERDHIARAAAALDDPYAALSQNLHGDGEWTGPGEKPHRYSPDPMMMGDCRICGHTASAHDTPTCATPGCTNRPVIRLDDRRLCQDCYANHDFGDDA